MNAEKWRPIPGYVGFWEVSDRDRVRGVGPFACLSGWDSLAEFKRDCIPLSRSEVRAHNWMDIDPETADYNEQCILDEARQLHPHLEAPQ